MNDLRRYADFQPTGFDAKGLHARNMGEGDEDRSDWRVCPVSQTRDSEDDPLTGSNWAAQLAALGGEGPDVEVHRFGHWGCGWFEIVIVRPGTEAERIADGLAGSLADYPVLDEEDHSRREYDSQIDALTDQAGSLVRAGAPEDWPAQLFTWLWDHAQREIDKLTQAGGGHVEDTILRQALRALKLMEPR